MDITPIITKDNLSKELIESFKKGEIDASILTTELTAYQPILQHSVDKLLEIGG